MTPEQQAKMEEARAMIKAVVDDGEAEINGRTYKFNKMVHKDRRRVFAYYTKIRPQVQRDDLSFMASDEFESVEAIINRTVSYNNSLLDRIDGHWDNYPEDYITFITTALQVISYPFFAASFTA